ncbi:hypothetical protein CANINC_000140, partial [Pichia inconspicua]
QQQQQQEQQHHPDKTFVKSEIKEELDNELSHEESTNDSKNVSHISNDHDQSVTPALPSINDLSLPPMRINQGSD